MKPKDHWQKVYSTKAVNAVSWFQEHAELSPQLIRATGVGPGGSIIDVGDGASTLVDDLLVAGYQHLSVLDLSSAALTAAQHRLGPRAASIRWMEADVTHVSLPENTFDLWHDRAVFHFLTSAEDRAAYVDAVLSAVKPGGHVIVATFAEDGPMQCSGLPVQRYSAEALHAEFGEQFALLRQDREAHRTPLGTIQRFVYCYCRTLGA